MEKTSREYAELSRFIDRHCPLEAGYYFLKRFDGNNQAVRYPASGTFRAQHPVEAPAAPAGQYFVYYAKDAAGREVVPHVGREGPLRLVLRRSHEARPRQQTLSGRTTPAESKSLTAGDVTPLLTAISEIQEDDAEGSLKATRIEAKKREIAIELTAKEQRVLRRGAVNKELVEGFMLNRAHRLEVRDQSEAMFRVQNQTMVMSERNLVLIEKIQESLGRAAELEKAAAQRAATPPGPIDYSPVLQSVVNAMRDIGVSFMQREQRLNPHPEDPAVSTKRMADRAEKEPLSDGSQAASSRSASAHTSTAQDPKRLEAEIARIQAENEATRRKIAEAEAVTRAGTAAPQAAPNGVPHPDDATSDPTLVLRHDAQQLLGRILAGESLGSSGEPLARPDVRPVDLLEQVLVAHSKMDSATAHKLLQDGTALEALGAFLFFNPMLRNILLQRRKG